MVKKQVGTRRKGEIIDAAAQIVSEHGIQKLSLSEIEKRTGMCRGQLTYYFKTKEQILIALYDRVISLMHERAAMEAPDMLGPRPDPQKAEDRISHVLGMVLEPNHLVNQHLHALQHTFLSQISHRDDLRKKLADLYREWRQCLSRDVEAIRTAGKKVNNDKHGKYQEGNLAPTSEEVATVYQALLHGLGMQIAADPNCVDVTRMATICKSLMANLVIWSKEGVSPNPLCSTPKG